MASPLQPTRSKGKDMRHTKLASVLGLVLAACSGGGGGGGGGTPGLQTILPAVSVEGGNALRKTTALPAAGSGPAVTASNGSAILPGGSALFDVSGSAAFDTIFVGVQGTPGYWQLTVPPGSSRTVVLSVGQNAPQTFTLVFGLANGSAVGQFETVPVTLTAVGTGAIQVSLTWDAESDVDLYLVEPDGTEIFYGNEVSASGGTLDLDSNAGCSIDGVKNENITYASATPQRGTYTVRVNYWDSCGVSASSYVVTVNVNGAVQTYSGTLTGAGVGGGSGAGTQVATFTY